MIPQDLLWNHDLFDTRYGYVCFDCKIKSENDIYKYVIGFSYNPPYRSILIDKIIVMVSQCPSCFKIYWLHCTDREIRAFQRYKIKKL